MIDIPDYERREETYSDDDLEEARAVAGPEDGDDE